MNILKGLPLAFATVFFAANLVNGLEDIRCPPAWTNLAKGDSIPSQAVVSDQRAKEVIIRVKVDGKYIGGRLIDGYAYVISQGQILNFTNFELLTNPHGCVTTWVSASSSSSFKVSFEDGALVGRIQDGEEFLPGQVSSGQIGYIDQSEAIRYKQSGYEYLTTFSRGLRLEMTNFEMSGDPFGGTTDILGMDEIHNAGDAEVSQVIVHRKRVFESILVSSAKWSSFTFGLEFDISYTLPVLDPSASAGGVNVSLEIAPSVGLTFGYDYSSSNERKETYYHSRETDVEVLREVIVPAYTTVQICSTVSTQNDFTVDYTAKGRYFAPGITSDEVAAILAKDGKMGYSEGDSIIVQESGTLQGSLYLMTQFIVVPIDPISGSGGCSQLSAKIQEIKRVKALSSFNDWSSNSRDNMEYEEEVKEIIRSFSKNRPPKIGC